MDLFTTLLSLLVDLLPSDFVTRLVPNTVKEAIWATLALGLFTLWTFPAVVQAERMYREKRLRGIWRSLYPLALLFLVADALFNIVIGTVLLRELPKLKLRFWESEWLFSARVQRHVTTKTGSAYRRAHWWAGQLNLVDPGHIKVRVPAA